MTAFQKRSCGVKLEYNAVFCTFDYHEGLFQLQFDDYSGEELLTIRATNEHYQDMNILFDYVTECFQLMTQDLHEFRFMDALTQCQQNGYILNVDDFAPVRILLDHWKNFYNFEFERISRKHVIGHYLWHLKSVTVKRAFEVDCMVKKIKSVIEETNNGALKETIYNLIQEHDFILCNMQEELYYLQDSLGHAIFSKEDCHLNIPKRYTPKRKEVTLPF